MPKFEFNQETNTFEYDGEDEIIFSKQPSAITLNHVQESNPINLKNVTVQGTYGLTFFKKIKVFWKLWKFMKY